MIHNLMPRMSMTIELFNHQLSIFFLTIMQYSIFPMAHNYYVFVVFLTRFNRKIIIMITWNFKLEIECTYKIKFQSGTIQKMFD